MPVAIDGGRVTVSGDGSSNQGMATVTFTAGTFTQTPNVTATARGIALYAAVTSETVAGCDIYVRRSDQEPWTGTVTVNWLAVQLAS